MFKSVLFFLFFSISVSSFAGSIEIAVINMERAYKEYYKTDIQTAKFNKQREIYKAYAGRLGEEDKELRLQMNKALESAQNISVKEEIRRDSLQRAEKLKAQIAAKQKEIYIYNQTKLKELKTKVEELRGQLISEIKNAVKDISILKGCKIVLDSSSKSYGDVDLVVYNSKYIDLTDEVVKKLNSTKK